MEKKWLVKIKGEVLGPFDQEELKEMASKGKLSADDEVTQSFKRWVYASALKELNLSSKDALSTTSFTAIGLNKENTQPHLVSEDSKEEGVETKKGLEEAPADTKTQKDKETPENITEVSAPSEDLSDYHELEEVTKPVSGASRYKKEIADEIDYEEVHEEEERPPIRPAHLPPEDQFGSIDQVKKMADLKAHVFNRWAWKVVVFIFSVGGIGFLFLKIYNDAKPASEAQFLKASHVYQESMEKGDYLTAFNLLKQLSVKRPAVLTSGDWMNLSALIIYTGGSIYEARGALYKSKEGGSFDPAKASLLDGIIKFHDKLFSNSDILLDRYLLIEPDSGATLLYKFLLKVSEDKLVEAQNILDRLRDILPQVNQPQLLSFLNTYSNYILAFNDSLEQDIVISAGLAYSQESLFVSLYHQVFAQGKGDIILNVQKFLDQDPYLTSENHYDILSPHPRLIWSHLLLNSCTTLYKNLSQKAYQFALHAFCKIQSGDKIKSSLLIEKALELHPKSPLILALYSYILTHNGMHEKSQIYLDQALSFNKENQFALPSILKARWCQKQGDQDCVEKYLNTAKNIKLTTSS